MIRQSGNGRQLVVRVPLAVLGVAQIGSPAAETARVVEDGARSRPSSGELTPVLGGYDEGFFIRSADGENELTIEGLFQVVGGALDAGRDPRTDFLLKRMRPQFGAKLAGWIRMNLEPNFNEDGLGSKKRGWAPSSFTGTPG